MDPGKDELIDREPWRRLLAADHDAPPQATDLRILAEARRALAPRSTRWWLPASLAASLFLAVVIGRWQLEDSTAPPLVTESDVLPAAARDAMSQRQELPAAAAEIPSPAVAAPPAERAVAAGIAPAAEIPAPAVSSARAREQSVAVESRADAAAPAPTAASAKALREFGKLPADQEPAAASRTPEQWYAEIEALRAAGHIEETESELKRLEAAWPGWLASHLKQEQ